MGNLILKMEKYTVVIPVKNSLETLKYTLQTCLKQTYPNFEILISDNCSTDGTAVWVKNLDDKRIKYIKPDRSLSMTENFEFALSHTKEGFVMCIGADDGLMPDAINYVNSLVLKYNAKAVSCQYAHYFWPDANIVNHGRLVLNALNIHKSTAVVRNSAEWIKKTIAFETKLYVCDLPNLYYGFVHRSIIDEAVKDNIYFRSITPDAYAAFVTAISVDEYVFSYKPFSIAGISSKSNGLSQMNGTDIAKDFVTKNVHPIHKDFVFCSAVEVILGEAFCQVADAFPAKCKDYKIDYTKMLQHAFLTANNHTYNEVEVAAKEMAIMHNLDYKKITTYTKDKLKNFFKRSFLMSSSLFSESYKLVGMRDSYKFGIENIYDASIALSILESLNEGNRIATVRSRFFERVKKRLFLSKHPPL